MVVTRSGPARETIEQHMPLAKAEVKQFLQLYPEVAEELGYVPANQTTVIVSTPNDAMHTLPRHAI